MGLDIEREQEQPGVSCQLMQNEFLILTAEVFSVKEILDSVKI
jgi:hypothetical protein